MFNFYAIKTMYGNFCIISISKHIAIIKAYNKYKKSRTNTSLRKFKKKIISITINK